MFLAMFLLMSLRAKEEAWYLDTSGNTKRNKYKKGQPAKGNTR